MTTLLVDNYDSFTFNLVQMLSSLGETVQVLKNDDAAGWAAVDWDLVDRIIVSPGPGHPAEPVDLGLSRAAVVGRARPLLGVCLGHQALCFLSGSTVQRAPQPMHGRTSRIVHSGDALFAGVPRSFRATRYHSLVVGQLSEELECIAESEDGSVMAVRHREWPAWGVQFHPESIGSQYGEQILQNFLSLTGGVNPRSAATAPPAPDPGPMAAARTDLGADWAELDHVPDAAAALEALFPTDDVAFWIDTLSTEVPESSLSYVGAGAGPGTESLSHRVADGFVRAMAPDGTCRDLPGSIFDAIGARTAELHVVSDAPVPLNLGYVGWLGYELRDLGGPGHGRRSPHPDAFLVLADRMLVIDNTAGRAWLAALRSGADDTTAADWVEWAGRVLRDLAPMAAIPEPSAVDLPPVQFRHDVPTYLGLIERCQELIRAGESYELCLTNQLTVATSVDPFELFRVLRRTSPAPFAAYFRTPEVAVVGSSPERFLTVDAGTMVSKPMKGTRPRGMDPEEDAHIREDLASSVKDRAENLMITDLVRNDLGSVASPGSIRVDPLFGIETFPHVHQMVSTVHGTLEPGRPVGDVLRATFPGGSMTGAPKRRSTELLDELEGDYRGIYSGALGFVALDGRVDLSMVIRTAVVTDDAVRVGVGGAITALSDAHDEVAEMLLKGNALLRAVALTMRRVPASG
jgi:para-aminobenzoate synthetase